MLYLASLRLEDWELIFISSVTAFSRRFIDYRRHLVIFFNDARRLPALAFIIFYYFSFHTFHLETCSDFLS